MDLAHSLSKTEMHFSINVIAFEGLVVVFFFLSKCKTFFYLC